MKNSAFPIDVNGSNATDEFSIFCQLAQSQSKSSSNNVSPEFRIRPRSKSVLYVNSKNLLLPETNVKAYKRSPSPYRKSLGNIPIIKTMIKTSDKNISEIGSRRPSLSPMKDSDDYQSNSRAPSSTCWFTEDLCHVRTFKTTGKGLINQGDVLVSKSKETIKYDSNNNRDRRSQCDEAPIKIQILGASGVGKTTLASQFMTSEQIFCRMWSVNEESEKLFSIRINGKEFPVLLYDTCNKSDDSSNEVSVELLDNMDAYIILFAIDDLDSFHYSKQILNDIINKIDNTGVVYLVGNKADLERSREVKSKVCKNLSRLQGCVFTEISTALNHRTDELIFNIVMDTTKKQSKTKEVRTSLYRRRESQIVSTGRTLGKILKKTFGTKSCEHIA